MSSFAIIDKFLQSVLSVLPGSDSADALVSWFSKKLAPECVQTRGIALDSEHCNRYILPIQNYRNFQNNAQVQINAWFELTPGTKHTVYNL